MAAGPSSSSGSRLLRATAAKAFHTDSHPPSSSSGNTTTGRPCRILPLKFPLLWETSTTTKQHGIGGRAAEQKGALIASGAAATGSTTPEKRRGVVLLPGEANGNDLLLPLAYEITRRLVFRRFGALTRRGWAKVAETVIHQGVVRCQSFALIGVAGSLVGSVPCFLEGCGAVLQSFLMQFRAMSQIVDQAEIIKLLIEALDMFLIGTALLTFGMGMYMMFCGSQSIQNPGRHVNNSQLGSFNLKKLKEGAGIQSITQAKSRFGHAVLLLLQAGVLEKFKSVPLVSGLDMACFAGAVLASSAGVFLLSKLAVNQRGLKQTFA